jgi:PKD repeat protein
LIKAPVVGSISVTPASPVLLQAATITMVGASDPNSLPLTYSWTFGDGMTGTGATTTHVYKSAGPFRIVATVGNGTLTAMASVDITVLGPPAAGTISGPTNPLMGLTQTFTISSGANDSGQTLSYAWAFGDGGTAAGQSVTHVFVNVGPYDVVATTTSAGGSSQAHLAVNVDSMAGQWHAGPTPDNYLCCFTRADMLLFQDGNLFSGSYVQTNIPQVGTVKGSIDPDTGAITMVMQQPFQSPISLTNAKLSADRQTFTGPVLVKGLNPGTTTPMWTWSR